MENGVWWFAHLPWEQEERFDSDIFHQPVWASPPFRSCGTTYIIFAYYIGLDGAKPMRQLMRSNVSWHFIIYSRLNKSRQ